MARKVKVRIRQNGKNINWIPSISLNLIKNCLKFAMRFGNKNSSKYLGSSNLAIINTFSYGDVNDFFDLLVSTDSFRLVEVESSDSYVNIEIL